MSLLDDLTAAADSLDPSLQPTANDRSSVLGALVHYTEHGQAFLDAAADSPQAVSDLLTGVGDKPPTPTPTPTPPTATADSSSSSSSSSDKPKK